MRSIGYVVVDFDGDGHIPGFGFGRARKQVQRVWSSWYTVPEGVHLSLVVVFGDFIIGDLAEAGNKNLPGGPSDVLRNEILFCAKVKSKLCRMRHA